MKNIFENAYFGKAYRTRDGRKALFSTDDEVGVYVYLEGYRMPIPYHYDGEPKETGIPSPNVRIISEWQEPIDEEELDKLALEYVGDNHGYTYTDIDDLPDHLVSEYDTFKAGYRKAKEQ